VKLKDLKRLVAEVALSLLFGGIFYAVCLAAFIQAYRMDNAPLQVIIRLLAPVITAAGFATGIIIHEVLSGARRTRFFRIFPWPLIGCAAGAGAVYWFGPMLIVFGMFVAGTASVALREFILSLKKAKS
jgi:RsiW-degrading membrane proteinase PrsW (M82 family)